MALGNMMTRAAERHRKIALDLIHGSGETVDVIVPAPRTPSSTGASLFGDLAEDSPSPLTKGPYSCLWHEMIGTTVTDPVAAGLVGLYPTAKSYILCSLEDTLVDGDDPTGQTWFDRAEYVVYRGKKYDVLGTDRSGMANVAPYLLIVALSGESVRHAK